MNHNIFNNFATKRDLENLKKDLTIRMGAMLATAVGILSLLITILAKLY